MTTSPLVSVIIPCFNAERFVGDAIRSALNQTYVRAEVIVVDDGSTDGSLDVLRSFKTDIRWTAGPNHGAPAARNQGIALARGEILQFLDADDILYPAKFAEQVPVIIENHLDSVWCDIDVVPFEGEACVPPHVRWTPTWHDDPVVIALGRNPGTPSPIYTAGIIRAVGGFRRELKCAQDRDLQIRVACANARFGYVPRALAQMRRHSRSLSANFTKVLEEYKRVIVPAYHSLAARGGMTDRRAAAFAAFMAGAARECMHLGDHTSAAAYLKIARQMHSSGGIGAAYGNGMAWIRRLLGPWPAERLALTMQMMRRRLVAVRQSTIHGRA